MDYFRKWMFDLWKIKIGSKTDSSVTRGLSSSASVMLIDRQVLTRALELLSLLQNNDIQPVHAHLNDRQDLGIKSHPKDIYVSNSLRTHHNSHFYLLLVGCWFHRMLHFSPVCERVQRLKLQTKWMSISNNKLFHPHLTSDAGNVPSYWWNKDSPSQICVYTLLYVRTFAARIGS